MKKHFVKRFDKVFFVYVVIGITLLFGFLLGLGISEVKNVGVIHPNSQSSIALPTQILDRNDNLITTFFSNENRELLDFFDIPRILMMALITREDQTFFTHHGFSFRGTTRAVWNLLTNNYVSGGSTLSQQVAGTLYADRRQFSVFRKLKELWWSLLLEKSWSKQEILAEYLNKVYFGHGNYGAETASHFFFNHSAKELNAAESVMLVIQLANPVKYSPFKNPNIARSRQETILNQMVDLGYVDKEEAHYDFAYYWSHYDYTRAGVSSAFLERNDKAPYFSEYIRGQLLEMGYTNDEINTGGFTVYTTLDLDVQEAAREEFDEGLEKSRRVYQSNLNRLETRERSIYSTAALFTMLFGATQLFDKDVLQKQEAVAYFNSNVHALLGISHLLFDFVPNTLSGNVVYESRVQSNTVDQEETVEGGLITLDNKNGYIVAMIGGSKFDATNQFNRAVDAFVQPGSSFKPLYYAAAVEDKLISPSSIIWDSPVVFVSEDAEEYVPRNYKGEWKGKVSVRQALSNSMNVPSLKVLDMVGFDRALEVSAALLGLTRDDWARAGLVKKYPIGLGIVSVAPIMMARAYATFANSGKALTPIAIRYIKDRDGKVVHETEKIKRVSNNSRQVLSPETAYIMTSLLSSTVSSGTLAYAQNQAGGFTQATAGKTGTTQNWSDSWTLGFTPYYTTAVWFGFDRGGQSLGTNQTGAVTTGTVWGKYMERINKDLPVIKFAKPQGIVSLKINPENNKKAVNNSVKSVNEIFIAGTEPKEWDDPAEAQIKNEFFIGQIDQSNWKLNIPVEQSLDEDAFFDYLTTNESKPVDTEDETNQNEANSFRLRLDVPSMLFLRSNRLSSQNSNAESRYDGNSSTNSNNPVLSSGSASSGSNANRNNANGGNASSPANQNPTSAVLPPVIPPTKPPTKPPVTPPVVSPETPPTQASAPNDDTALVPTSPPASDEVNILLE